MRKSSELRERRLEKLLDFGERVASLSQPGLHQGGSGHMGSRAARGTRATADFARHDQGAHGAFGGMVVRLHSRRGEKGEEFTLMAQEAFRPWEWPRPRCRPAVPATATSSHRH